MKERIIQTLQGLREYALNKGYVVALDYHEEESCLMRFANSAISLNTNEHLIRVEVTAYDGRRRASYEMITNLDQVDEMRRGIDTAAELVKHAQPLNYDPTLPEFHETFADDSGYDDALARIANEDRLAYFNEAVKGLETGEIRAGGIFANGATTLAQVNTRSPHTQYFKTSDAQVNVVLSHSRLKWEVIAEQSAHNRVALVPQGLQRELAFLLHHYQNDPAQQIPIGKYDVVFGAAAIADLLNYMNWIGFNGGSMKRGFSFLGEADVCQKVFSDQFTLVDDPGLPETFPFRRDFTGIERKPYPLFEKGVFTGFVWYQDDADEHGQKATGHTVLHKSLALRGGAQPAPSLEALAAMPRDRDLLYIPFLHYMGIVNPSKGIVTGSSRFGAMLLKQDGSVVIPYNVRFTHSLREFFGDQVAWISRETVPYNTSMSYGARNPTAIVVPKFMRVNGLEISHSNTSY